MKNKCLPGQEKGFLRKCLLVYWDRKSIDVFPKFCRRKDQHTAFIVCNRVRPLVLRRTPRVSPIPQVPNEVNQKILNSVASAFAGSAGLLQTPQNNNAVVQYPLGISKPYFMRLPRHYIDKFLSSMTNPNRKPLFSAKRFRGTITICSRNL